MPDETQTDIIENDTQVEPVVATETPVVPEVDEATFEFEQKMKEFTRRSDDFTKKENEFRTKFEVANNLDQFLRLHPEKLGQVQAILSGTDTGVTGMEEQDPTQRRLAELERQLQSKQTEEAKRYQEQTILQQQDSLKSEVTSLSTRYPFLKDPVSRDSVLMKYARSGNNTSLYDCVKWYQKGLDNIQKQAVSGYLDGKKKIDPMLGKGGVSGKTLPSYNKAPIGSEASASALEQSLARHFSK